MSISLCDFGLRTYIPIRCLDFKEFIADDAEAGPSTDFKPISIAYK